STVTECTKLKGGVVPRFRTTAATIALIATTCGLAEAQKITATIRGDVTGPTGASISGARIVAHNLDTGVERQGVSDDRGAYVPDFLPPGPYDVTAEQQGFSRRRLAGIVLQVNQDVRLDIALQVGEVRQEVSVEAAAPLLQASSSSVGSVIEQRQVHNLPLNGRQFLQLALLTPGAVTAPPGGRQASERGTLSSAININGIARARTFS
ncbi:MAG: carboxypeptidase regulatory-like domain-containing protein, partial [Acidobacteria bacterium]|nr:carboxypeptidase regulatory-like domain-containing protein [Acidobacteriota bacterium]